MAISNLFNEYGLLLYVVIVLVILFINFIRIKNNTKEVEKIVNPSDKWVQYDYQRKCIKNPEWEALLERRESLNRIEKYTDIPKWFYDVWKFNKHNKNKP